MMQLTRRSFVGASVALVFESMLGAQAPASAGPPGPQLMEDLVLANHILYQEGIVDAFGHVSVRHDRDPNRYLLARSVAPELVAAEDILEFDLDSNAVNARGRALYSERFIHGEIYKARPDVKSVVHNHAPSLIPFGASTVALQPMLHVAAFIGQGLAKFDIFEAAGPTDMLVSTPALGRALSRALAQNPVVLMRGHGAVVVGTSVMAAVGRSIYLDMNAKIQTQTMALGGKITYLHPEEVQARKSSENYERAWDLWKRKAGGK